MAETTAGYPFRFEVFVNNDNRYVIHDKKSIKLSLKAFPRTGRQIRLCNYDKDQIFLISSSSPVELNYSNTSFQPSDLLDDIMVIKPKKFESTDVISITIKAEEIENNVTMESRGLTSLIIID
jgi:hypothetical protein